jgi:DNA-binding MarR family transcriptional regulator
MERRSNTREAGKGACFAVQQSKAKTASGTVKMWRLADIRARALPFACPTSQQHIDCTMPPHDKPSENFRSREQQATLGLLRTADAVKRSLAQVIEPHGITPQQYNVLRILRGAGPDGLPTLSIGERMIEQTPGVTRLIDRLERKGLVGRTPCATDRRRVLCRMTSKGLDLLKELDEPVNRWDAQAVSVLPPSELDSLIDLLDRVRASNY